MGEERMELRMETFNVNYALFAENLSRGYKQIRDVDCLSDITLVCDDGELLAHKVVLFTGSDFFKSFLQRVKHPNPHIYLRGMKLQHLQLVLNFMYSGEAQIIQSDLGDVLEVAKDLKVTGLTEQEQQQQHEAVMEEATKVSKKLDTLIKSITEMKEKEGKNKKKTKVKDEVSQDGDGDAATPTKAEDDFDEIALSHMKKGYDVEGKVSWICNQCGFCCNDKTRTKRHIKNNHLKERRKSAPEKITDIEEEISSTPDVSHITDVASLLEDVEVKRPRTRKMNRELKSLINDIEQAESAGFNIFDEIFDEDKESNNDESLVKESEESATDIESQALEMMEQGKDEENNRILWICRICDYSSHNKTRVKKHAKSNHLQKPSENEREGASRATSEIDEENKESSESEPMDTSDADQSKAENEETLNETSIKGNFDSDDVQALSLMMKSTSETGRTTWQCTICDMSHNDKTRIRKHIKSRHIRNSETS